MTSAAARHLLFGLLALQNGLIDQGQLVAAFQAWTLDKSRSLADHLQARGDLTGPKRAALEALAAVHVEAHGGDVEKSLAAVPADRSTRASLAALGEPEIEATLARVTRDNHGQATELDDDPDRTSTLAVGGSTGDGQRFRLLRPHARGGLGEVFVALDAELHREVALKQILEKHADDPVSRQRFVLEAEVTGGLEHPGIVPVYGLGTYGSGRPYYAMRFIKGESLKEAIEQFHRDDTLKNHPGRRSLELRKLLRRFLDVCNAIDYAHSRGVIHRDIKPANIILGKHGETLVVDWGLAKAVGRADPSVGEQTLAPSSSGSSETQPGSALGTPAYMSPEQASGDLDRLGPRSDVYSLGATLYCLLTGKPPFEGEDVGETLRKVQQGAFVPPRQLEPSLDAALEAVCLKAMANQSGDRYPSCRALADDVERWMADEPVSAWREPLSARARRWARQYRTGVTGAAAALLAGLIGLAAVAAVQACANAALERKNLQLADAHAATERALTATQEEKQKTEAALAQSEEGRQRAEAVLGFLKEDVLATVRPQGQDGGLGPDVTVRRAVDQAEPKIAERFRDQPIVEADIRDTLGGTYFYFGEAPLAIRQAERALELRRARLGPDHPDTLTSRNNLAAAYWSAGRPARAIELHEANLKLQESKLGPDHPDTLMSRNNLAAAYLDAGRTAEAITLQQATLKLRESKLGPDHPDTLISRRYLARAYLAAGQLDRAVALIEQAFPGFRAKNGPDHFSTLRTEQLLADAYESLDRLVEAEALRRDTLARRRKAVSPNNPLLAGDLAALGQNLLNQSRWSEAEPLLREALAIREKATPDDWARYDAMSLLGGSLLGQGRYAEAEPLVVAGYEGLKARGTRIVVPERSRLREAAERVVRLYEDWGQPEKAALWKDKLGMPDLPADVFARP